MSEILSWFRGDLDTPQRIWSALFPALLIVGAFLIYWVRGRIKGGYCDEEVAARGETLLIPMGPRHFFAWLIDPIVRLLVKGGVPPNAVTILSVLLSIGAGVAIAAGRFSLGGWLYLSAGACDFIDGRLARGSGRASPGGAAFDSVLDRYAEAVVFVGFAWFYRDRWVLLPVLAALIGSFLISYVRARGEGLGVDVKMGLMQRPERMVILGVTAALSPVIEALIEPNNPRPIHRLAVAGVVVLAVFTQFTALQRLLHVVRALSKTSVARVATIRRNVVAAAVGTGADFLLVLLLIARFQTVPWVATAIGCILGGALNYVLNRVWTFRSIAPPIGESVRYVAVSLSSALLNAGGVALFLLLPEFPSLIAWIVVRALIFSTWNYPLQSEFVYRRQAVFAGHE